MSGPIPSRPFEPWAIQAARNVMVMIPFLVAPGEDTPAIRMNDLVARIQRAFPDRQAWNQAVHESLLQPEEKIWLIVP